MPHVLRANTVLLSRRSIRPQSAYGWYRRGLISFLPKPATSPPAAPEDVPVLALVALEGSTSTHAVDVQAKYPIRRVESQVDNVVGSWKTASGTTVKKLKVGTKPPRVRLDFVQPVAVSKVRRRFLAGGDGVVEGGVVVRKLTVRTPAKPAVTNVARAPAALFEGGRRVGADAEGVVVRVHWRDRGGAAMHMRIYVGPEEIREEWDYWKRRRSDPRTHAGLSPLASELEVELTEWHAKEMYFKRLAEGENLPLRVLSLETRLARAVANANQRSPGIDGVPKDTVMYTRVITNVQRIVQTPVQVGELEVENHGGVLTRLPREEAIARTVAMAQMVIFEFEKFVGLMQLSMKCPPMPGRELFSTFREPLHTHRLSDFPVFVFIRSILAFEKFEANVMRLLSTPLIVPTVEIRTAANAHHLPRHEAIGKICRNLGSALGLADIGLRHIKRRGSSEADYFLAGYMSLATKFEKNIANLLHAPPPQTGAGVEYTGKDAAKSGLICPTQMIERISEQHGRMLFLADRAVRLSLIRPRLRRVQIASESPVFSAARIYVPSGARGYATMRGVKRPRFKPGKARPSKPVRQGLRDVFVAKEMERMEGLKGIYASSTRDDGSPATVPDASSTDDTFGNPWEGGDLSDIGDASGPLQIGDLCEIRSGIRAELGVFMRPTLGGEPTCDCLLAGGDITRRQPPRITFSVPNFVPQEDVLKVLNYYDRMIEIHKNSGRLDFADLAAPREITVNVLAPLRRFVRRSSELYAEQRPLFDSLWAKIAHDTEETRIKLPQATEMVFGQGCDTSVDYRCMLHAMHVAMMGDGVRFMGDRGMHRATNVFRVRSKKDLGMIDSVTGWIRKNMVVLPGRESWNRQSSFAAEGRVLMTKFIEKARYLIDLSREYRNEAKQGSRQGTGPVERVDIGELEWDENDQFFIEYIKARVLKYGLQSTPIDGLAPVILRDTDRYGDTLDATTADEFLREIGAWSTWENTSLHQCGLNLPGLGKSKVGDEDEARFAAIEDKDPIRSLGLRDAMKHIRKDWGQMEVFTIDDAGAHEIDDGISLERIPGGKEFWIHAHIANPTAFIPRNHWIEEIARRRVVTHYLPERVYAMLPTAITSGFLGVAANRPVLTVSTKIDERGDILDYKIQAGYVRNVTSTTYEAIDRVLGSFREEQYTVDVKIGEFPDSPKKQPRHKPFTKRQVADFQMLYELASTIRRRRARDGLIVTSSPTLGVKVDDGLGSSNHPYDSPHPVLYRGHPAIRLTVQEIDRADCTNAQLIVSEVMSLANSAVARWSTAHKLAMPYRVMEFDERRPDVVKIVREKVYPRRTDLGRAPFDETIRWLMLLGQTQLLPNPGPQRLLGLETGYVKTTSPLRRYSDMLAHHQIQSVLLGDRPTAAQDMEHTLADIKRGEQASKYISGEAHRLWAAVAIKRARQLGFEGFKFPKVLTVMVMEKNFFPTPSNGIVRELGMAGKLVFDNKRDEHAVAVGDIVEVEIRDVRLGERYIWFGFLRLVKGASETLGRFA